MPEPPEDGELEALLDYVRERRNFDFRGYKRASLTRRIFKRMQDRPAARDRAGDMGLSQWWRIRLWSCA